MHARQYDKKQTGEVVLRLFAICVGIALAGAIVVLLGGVGSLSMIQVTGALVTQIGVTTGMLLLVTLFVLSLASVLGLVRNSNPAALEIIMPSESEAAASQRDVSDVRGLARRVTPVALVFNLGLSGLTFSRFANTRVASLLIALFAVVAVLALMRILTAKDWDSASPLAQ